MTAKGDCAKARLVAALVMIYLVLSSCLVEVPETMKLVRKCREASVRSEKSALGINFQIAVVNFLRSLSFVHFPYNHRPASDQCRSLCSRHEWSSTCWDKSALLCPTRAGREACF
jgi:hypothetical protein